MITQNLSTLIINKLSAKQYDDALAAGQINANELYLTPEEDLSRFLTREDASKLYATQVDLENIQHYIFDLDYNNFKFNTSEIVIGNNTNLHTAVLGKAKLGQMKLGSV